ncbi:MAG: flagellar hook protein FlgE [Deltaproteobacteria bacterium]|nr:flagellar hook protein FlgE [Deltaproteobacteria bacterium]MBW2302783.1 flagellar hook protein FlgE [Deltaproteobacteria bacterium]
MALSSALFSGISGLNTLGNAMQIIGDNIANVNTIGFKGATFTFQDLLSQATATMSGTSQVGRGVGLGDIYSSFEQGSFETTGNTTDLAIGGQGFFVVRESDTENLFYTRAGNFRFDRNGYLVNPEGYVVQGWELDDNGEDVGSVTDIRLDSFTSSPVATSRITIVTNLDSDASSNCADLSLAWDGNNSSGTYMDESNYEYQSTVKVYDSLGGTHDLTVYYDPTSTSGVWEYIIVCNPDEDERGGSDSDCNGLLAKGEITFSTSEGKVTNITMYLNDGDGRAAGNWTAASIDSHGYYYFQPNFGTGTQDIEFDIGTRDSTGGGSGGPTWVNDSLTTTQFARASTTTFQSANGYGAGDLQGVDVDVDGVITGVYSNGEIIPLFRVALAKFQNINGLLKEGGNLYRETRESGDAITNRPGTNGLGSIAPNSLEQSNVDIANEFVKMITTQRGFQANGKIITVTDAMLAELINLKR